MDHVEARLIVPWGSANFTDNLPNAGTFVCDCASHLSEDEITGDKKASRHFGVVHESLFDSVEGYTASPPAVQACRGSGIRLG